MRCKPTTPRVLHGGIAKRIFAAPLVSAILWSMPCGISASAGTNFWTTNGPEGESIIRLAIDPVTTTTLYAGAGALDGGSEKGHGLFKSTDAGSTWQALDNELSQNSITALAIDPNVPDTLYAGTDGGVFKSIDGGVSWQDSTANLADRSIRV